MKLCMMQLLWLLPTLSSAFVVPTTTTTTTPETSTRLYDGNGTGGWGIGGQRELTPEEFSRSGDRSYFDGYQMREQGDFQSQLAQEKASLKRAEMEELLGVASIAGINVKNPKDRLNKFDNSYLEDDDLDLSV